MTSIIILTQIHYHKLRSITLITLTLVLSLNCYSQKVNVATAMKSMENNTAKAYTIHAGGNITRVDEHTCSLRPCRLGIDIDGVTLWFRVINNKVKLTCTFFNTNNELSVFIEEGNLRKNKRYTKEKDATGFEVVDPAGLVWFQWDIIKNDIYVRGVFDTGVNTVVLNDRGIIGFDKKQKGYDTRWRQEAGTIRRIFKYTGPHGVREAK